MYVRNIIEDYRYTLIMLTWHAPRHWLKYASSTVLQVRNTTKVDHTSIGTTGSLIGLWVYLSNFSALHSDMDFDWIMAPFNLKKISSSLLAISVFKTNECCHLKLKSVFLIIIRGHFTRSVTHKHRFWPLCLSIWLCWTLFWLSKPDLNSFQIQTYSELAS
jgi:hypothetical protein